MEDRRKFSLIVSLPENRVEFATAALAGGADAIKVHLNVEHRASGTRFGPFSEEFPHLEEISRAVGRRAALGIMPGADRIASLEELDHLAGLGFEFLDCYLHHLPVRYLGHGALRRVLAVGPDYRLEEVRGLSSLGADALEASIIEPAGYGHPLTTADLLRYRSLVAACRLPVVVPTQRRIAPEDVGLLAWAGVSGIMIGAVVTGKEPEGVRTVTARFREAIARSVYAG